MRERTAEIIRQCSMRTPGKRCFCCCCCDSVFIDDFCCDSAFIDDFYTLFFFPTSADKNDVFLSLSTKNVVF